MSDNVKRFRAIKQHLSKSYEKVPRHLETLTCLVNAIIAKGSVSLTKAAGTMPGEAKNSSNEIKLRRFVKNHRVDTETYFMPFIRPFLEGLAISLYRRLVIAVDITGIGKNTCVLMASVIYKTRSIPIAWIVLPHGKGHTTQDNHIYLLDLIEDVIPTNTEVILVGDGEYDGTRFQDNIAKRGWYYVVRTAKDLQIQVGQDCFEARETGLVVEAINEEDWFIADISITQNQFRLCQGILSFVGWRKAKWHEDIYLLTNFELGREAIKWYEKRFQIETFFSDQKSRGFHLHKTHLTHTDRLDRLMIACCLAYIWISLLGQLSVETGLKQHLDRNNRQDLSIFRLGLALLEYWIKNDHEIYVVLNILELKSLTEKFKTVR